MRFAQFLPMLMILIVYLAIIAGIFYLIFRWVSTIIALKREHNELLKEIIKKMEIR